MTDPLRRRLLRSLAVSLSACVPGALRAGASDVIDVRALGASGDGTASDLAYVREAMERARQRPGSAVLFRPGEYFLGTARESILVSAEALANVSIVGEGATLSCRSLEGSSTMLELVGCRGVTVRGLAFRDDGLDREIDWRGAAGIRLSNRGNAGCRDIAIERCRFDSVLAAIVCRRTEDDLTIRTRGIRLADLTVSRSYYGLSFQDNGDDVVGRNLKFDDVKRSYFPFGVSNHDVELDTRNNATGYTDVLIKCYHADTTGIKAAVRCRGKRGGDAIVALDQQHEQARGLIGAIDLRLDIDDVDCRLDTVVLIRSLDAKGATEKETRSRWDGIAIDGSVRICDKTKLVRVATRGLNGGRLHIGPVLAANRRLPRSFPGFTVTGL